MIQRKQNTKIKINITTQLTRQFYQTQNLYWNLVYKVKGVPEKKYVLSMKCYLSDLGNWYAIYISQCEGNLLFSPKKLSLRKKKNMHVTFHRARYVKGNPNFYGRPCIKCQNIFENISIAMKICINVFFSLVCIWKSQDTRKSRTNLISAKI